MNTSEKKQRPRIDSNELKSPEGMMSSFMEFKEIPTSMNKTSISGFALLKSIIRANNLTMLILPGTLLLGTVMLTTMPEIKPEIIVAVGVIVYVATMIYSMIKEDKHKKEQADKEV